MQSIIITLITLLILTSCSSLDLYKKRMKLARSINKEKKQLQVPPFEMKPITFITGSSKLDREDYKTLMDLVSFIKKFKVKDIVIINSVNENKLIQTQREDIVYDFLQLQVSNLNIKKKTTTFSMNKIEIAIVRKTINN